MHVYLHFDRTRTHHFASVWIWLYTVHFLPVAIHNVRISSVGSMLLPFQTVMPVVQSVRGTRCRTNLRTDYALLTVSWTLKQSNATVSMNIQRYRWITVHFFDNELWHACVHNRESGVWYLDTVIKIKGLHLDASNWKTTGNNFHYRAVRFM